MTTRAIYKMTVAGALACDIFLACSAAHADTEAGVRKTLQALYDRASAALGRKDLAGATAIDTPNYVTYDDKGVAHTLEASRERASKLLERPQTVQMTVKIGRLTLKGNQAVVDVSQHLYMKYTNPKTHHVFITDQRLTSTDQWAKQGATWRRTLGRTHTVRAYVNGQLAYSTPKR